MRIIVIFLVIAAIAWGVINITNPLSKSAYLPTSASVVSPQLPAAGNPEPTSNSGTQPFDRTKFTIQNPVPFTPQAPFADWKDPRQQDACEETSALMAVYWAEGKTFTRQQALDIILAVSKYEQETYGTFMDTSAADTGKRIIDGYFHYTNYKIITSVTLDQLVQELVAGHLLIVPANGQVLNNPYFTAPGPQRHMIVIKGYDGTRREFITNDPGIAQGEGYRYPEDVFYNAIRDYPTGDNLPITGDSKVAISISK